MHAETALLITGATCCEAVRPIRLAELLLRWSSELSRSDQLIRLRLRVSLELQTLVRRQTCRCGAEGRRTELRA